MLDSVLISEEMTLTELLICTGASIVFGIICAWLFAFKNKYYTKSFIVTLALLPTIVQVIILLVNGNIGTGIAVMGAFNLVRFRSVPGNAREIGSIFLAMAMGLATGMGYVGVGLIILVIVGIMNIVLISFKFGKDEDEEKQLRIILPENLNYTDIFDDIFQKYLSEYELKRVKTTNMGSLFELIYIVKYKKDIDEKQFIDDLRCRNGNLEIMCSKVQVDLDRM